MRVIPLHTLLFWILATLNFVSGRAPCIEDHDVGGIAQRWLNAFATGGLHTLPDAVTENVRKTLPDSQPIC